MQKRHEIDDSHTTRGPDLCNRTPKILLSLLGVLFLGCYCALPLTWSWSFTSIIEITVHKYLLGKLFTCIIQQNVLRFQVSVDDSVLVEVLQPADDLRRVEARSLVIKAWILFIHIVHVKPVRNVAASYQGIATPVTPKGPVCMLAVRFNYPRPLGRD